MQSPAGSTENRLLSHASHRACPSTPFTAGSAGLLGEECLGTCLRDDSVSHVRDDTIRYDSRLLSRTALASHLKKTSATSRRRSLMHHVSFPHQMQPVLPPDRPRRHRRHKSCENKLEANTGSLSDAFALGMECGCIWCSRHQALLTPPG